MSISSSRLLVLASLRTATALSEASAVRNASTRAFSAASTSASSTSTWTAADKASSTSPSTFSSTSSPNKLALEAFRAHNSSLPGIAGSTTLAKVLRVEREFVTVDGGCLKRPVRLARAELREGQLVSSPLPKDDANRGTQTLLRSGPTDVRVGDVLRFHVVALESPYGDAVLSAEPRPRPAAARAAAWSAVLSASSAHAGEKASSVAGGSSVATEGKVVHGRVLNPLPTGGGYAVGVAGVVGFLPFSGAAPSTGARVGVLQRFRVISAVPETGSFVLEDEGAAARREASAKRRAAYQAAAAARGEQGGEGGEGVEGERQQQWRTQQRAGATGRYQQQRGSHQHRSSSPRWQQRTVGATTSTAVSE